MDDIDRADIFIESVIDNAIAIAMRAANQMQAGKPGECVSCGQDVARLINGNCLDCRREFGLSS